MRNKNQLILKEMQKEQDIEKVKLLYNLTDSPCDDIDNYLLSRCGKYALTQFKLNKSKPNVITLNTEYGVKQNDPNY